MAQFPKQTNISTLFFDLLITNCFERRRSRLVSFSIEQCTPAFRIQRRKKEKPASSSRNELLLSEEEGEGKITDQMLRKEDFSLPLRHFGERRTKKVKLSVCQNVYNKDIFREKKSTHTSPPPFAIPHSPPPAQFQPISLAPSNFFFPASEMQFRK